MEIVRDLLGANTDVNIQGNSGLTALHMASMFGYVDVVKDLLNINAPGMLMSDSGNTASDFATSEEMRKVFKRHLYVRHCMTILCLTRKGMPLELASYI